jgi:hypothetical protein
MQIEILENFAYTFRSKIFLPYKKKHDPVCKHNKYLIWKYIYQQHFERFLQIQKWRF